MLEVGKTYHTEHGLVFYVLRHMPLTRTFEIAHWVDGTLRVASIIDSLDFPEASTAINEIIKEGLKYRRY